MGIELSLLKLKKQGVADKTLKNREKSWSSLSLMATSSSMTAAAALSLVPHCKSTISTKPRIYIMPLNVSKLTSLKSTHSSSSSSFRVFAAPELLQSETLLQTIEVDEPETLGTNKIEIAADVEKMAPTHKIRIKLKSYYAPLIEDSCKQIMDAAKTTNAKTIGPIPLPTKKSVFCVLKSPHIHKDARNHFEIRTHQRVIDILDPTSQTINSLMQLNLPSGVDVEVKL